MDELMDNDDLEKLLLLENVSARGKSQHDFPCISSLEKSVMVASNKIKSIGLDESKHEPPWKLEENMKAGKTLTADEYDKLVDQLQGKDLDWFKISSEHFEDVHSPLDCRVMWNVFLHPRINKNSWTKLEDVKLKEITKRYKFQNWDRIAAQLNTNRSAYQCFIRYNTIRKLPKVRNFIWKHREDDKLLKLVKIFQIGDFIPWGEVASWMQNRTKQQVYFRWTYSLAPYLTKGRFSKSEDNILRDAVAKYGTNFRKISAALMPNRSTVQLHDRYQTLVNSQMKNWNVWSLEEDSKLLELFERFGPNWSRIAKTFTCKTRTKLRHRHAALQKYINKGVSIHDLHRDYFKDKNEINQEKRNKESDRSDRIHYFNRGVSKKDHKDCNDDIDKELIKYFHTEQTIEKSLDHRQRSYTSDELERDVNKLYNILRQLNAQLSIPDDVFNNSMLHDRHRQLLCSLKEYTDVKNNKNKQRMVIDEYSSLMFGVNHSNFVERASGDKSSCYFQSKMKFECPNKTRCIDYPVNTKSIFLVEETRVFHTPDVVVSHIGGKEQELEFEKLARLLVQSSSSKDKQFVRTIKDKGFYAFPSGMSLNQNYSATNSRDNGNRSSLNVPGRINRATSCSQRENTIRNIMLFNAFETTHEFTSATSVETPRDQYIPPIETTHSTLFSFKRLLGLKPSFTEEHNNPQKFHTISKSCQRSLNLLETRLEQLFKYPIGLSRTTLPEVYVMDTFSYDDVKSKRKASEPPTIPKPCKTRKLQIIALSGIIHTQ
ncbi:proximal sequence element A Pbp95 isoform X2 [Halictus rubicundus]|uniref:proximal sequence element A Pbp95 isoform X2 n=1 Tax=Halictus rubicundus TaxID=77578 RepID=UPI00403597D1